MKRLHHILPFSGYFILVGMVMILLTLTSFEALKTNIAGGIISLTVLVGAVFAIFYEGQDILRTLTSLPESKPLHRVWEFTGVFIGGVLAYYLSQDFGLGPVIAASLVGVLAHMIVPDFSVAVYCGSFVGMVSNALLFNPLEVALASLIAGLVFVLTSKVFAGFGGKLGTIALIGVVLTGVGLGRQFLITPMADWQTNALIILIALIAAPLTFYLNCNKGNGSVMASAVVGLAGGLLLPVLFPQNGNTLAVVMICASFTGMTNEIRCPKFWHMILAGMFTGVIFVFSAPLLGGAGGKLGTIAFAAVLATSGYTRLFESFFGSSSRHQTDRTK